MKVTMLLQATLAAEVGRNRVELELPAGALVKDALARLPAAEIEYASTVRNEDQAREDEPLSDGDVLYVFPPMAGG